MKNLNSLKNLLWIDAITAILSGSLGLILVTELSKIFALSTNLLTIMSLLSFCFAGVAIYLANQKTMVIPLVKKFVIANWLWVVSCIVLIAIKFNASNLLGIVFLILQSLFVAVLAILQGLQIKTTK